MARLLSSRRILHRLFPKPSPLPLSTLPPYRKPYRGIQLPPLIPSATDSLDGFSIDLVDSDLWQVSFGPAQARNEPTAPSQPPPDSIKGYNNHVAQEFPDFDEIDNLRLRKKLFYKLDKGSKEFDESNVTFHRKHNPKRIQDKKGRSQVEKHTAKLSSEKVKPVKPAKTVKQKSANSAPAEVAVMEGKKVRVPTFNQVTDPYHLPFCLDIYITKGSVRACIVHRVTSKVVAVAHSISKDMKLDLASRKDSVTSAAIGQILAQRAIEDDIHNVVYTPRKGDKIEGKLQIVLQSIIDHGVDVKVKLKQKKHNKTISEDIKDFRGRAQDLMKFLKTINTNVLYFIKYDVDMIERSRGIKIFKFSIMVFKKCFFESECGDASAFCRTA